jgi:hypothetical protein
LSGHGVRRRCRRQGLEEHRSDQGVEPWPQDWPAERCSVPLSRWQACNPASGRQPSARRRRRGPAGRSPARRGEVDDAAACRAVVGHAGGPL